MAAPSYRSLIWSAWITAGFSLVVGLALAVSFLQRSSALPLDDPRYLELQQQLAATQDAEQVRQELRSIDVQLRGEYFRRLRFARRGALLLALGVITTVLLWQWAFTVKRRLPLPKTGEFQDPSDASRAAAGWACGGLVALLVLGTLTWQVATRDDMLAFDQLAFDQQASSAGDPDVARDLPSDPDSPGAGLSNTAETPSAAETPPSAEAYAANWYRFRGAGGSGVTRFGNIAREWNGEEGKNVAWKTAIDLPGVGSPVLWENHLFVTGANEQERAIYCLDALRGKLLWKRPVTEASEPDPDMRVDPSTGYAASTPATDGRRVYAIFANGDLIACDLEGKVVWSQSLGPLDNPYGHASSLDLFQDLLIVQLDQGSKKVGRSRLMALHSGTGEIAWEVEREVLASWSSPIVVTHEGEPRVITSADPWVIAYAATDGRELWRADCLVGDIGPSPVYRDGKVYVANEYAAGVVIRDGGEGDVTESHIQWRTESALPDICSPLATESWLLLVPSYGALACFNTDEESEEPIWEEDLGAILLASPSLAGDMVYLLSDEGTGWVVQVTADGCERIAENSLGERCVGSPAFAEGRMYLRGENHLFCIQESP